MKLRQGADAILVGVNTILADDPGLTFRSPAFAQKLRLGRQSILLRQGFGGQEVHPPSLRLRRTGSPKLLRRVVLDSLGRTPVRSKVVSDEFAELTTIVVSEQAPEKRVMALAKRVKVLVAPTADSQIDLFWLLKMLGAQEVTSLLVEGGGEVNASFLLGGFAQRVAFFFAPKILGGRDSKKAVGGAGVGSLREIINLSELEWRKVGPDLFLMGRVGS